MNDENVVHLDDWRQPSDAAIEAELAAIAEHLRIDFDFMRDRLFGMSMAERGVVGTALLEAMANPAPSFTQVALLLLLAKPRGDAP